MPAEEEKSQPKIIPAQKRKQQSKSNIKLDTKLTSNRSYKCKISAKKKGESIEKKSNTEKSLFLKFGLEWFVENGLFLKLKMIFFL